MDVAADMKEAYRNSEVDERHLRFRHRMPLTEYSTRGLYHCRNCVATGCSQLGNLHVKRALGKVDF